MSKLNTEIYINFHEGEYSESVENEVKTLLKVLTGVFITDGFSKDETIKLLHKTGNTLKSNKLISELIDDYKVLPSTTDRPTEKTDSIEYPEQDNDTNEILEDGIFIENAGLILLWPFLKTFFAKLGMLDNNNFSTDTLRNRAVLLLNYLVTGDTKHNEHELALNKILCGMPVHYPVVDELIITDLENKETQQVIQSAIDTWKGIGKVSVSGFRESFLKRNGKLQLNDTGWNLIINRGALDVLLDRLPWGISMIKLKWMNKILYVDW